MTDGVIGDRPILAHLTEAFMEDGTAGVDGRHGATDGDALVIGRLIITTPLSFTVATGGAIMDIAAHKDFMPVMWPCLHLTKTGIRNGIMLS